MEDIKKIIVQNLVDLRKKNKLTQMELAEKLNYSDKAVSRWERGDALPDIDVLCRICEIYGVTFDYLTHEGTAQEKEDFTTKEIHRNKLVIALLAITAVWFFAIIIYIFFLRSEKNFWTIFVWAVPVSFFIGFIFNSIWGKRRWSLTLLSFLLWTFLTAFFLQMRPMFWPIFLAGAPLQLAIVLWGNLTKKPQERSDKKSDHAQETNEAQNAGKEEDIPTEKTDG